MSRVRLLPLLIGAIMFAMLAPTAAAAKPAGPNPVTKTVTGTLADGTGSVAGTLTINRFARQNGGIVALGTFDGTVTDAVGNVTSGSQALALPVAITQATCQVLNLDLGPLDLNLLGLMVHLDEVVLNITAVSGPGNLLGNLLCAVAGLLDPGPGPLGAITALLNQILSILQGL